MTHAPAGTVSGIDIFLTRGRDHLLKSDTVIATAYPVIEQGDGTCESGWEQPLSRTTVTTEWPFPDSLEDATSGEAVFTVGQSDPEAAQLNRGALLAYRTVLALVAASRPEFAKHVAASPFWQEG